MILEDFEGATEVTNVDGLIQRLKTSRRGDLGAFQLIGTNQTSLEIGFNGEFAFLYFFPDAEGVHPGYETIGMTPPNCPKTVFVYQPSGQKADGFEIPSEYIVSAEAAYTAAAEYFEKQKLPASITWFEL